MKKNVYIMTIVDSGSPRLRMEKAVYAIVGLIVVLWALALTSFLIRPTPTNGPILVVESLVTAGAVLLGAAAILLTRRSPVRVQPAPHRQYSLRAQRGSAIAAATSLALLTVVAALPKPPLFGFEFWMFPWSVTTSLAGTVFGFRKMLFIIVGSALWLMLVIYLSHGTLAP